MDPVRQLAGKRAKQNGKDFEKMLEVPARSLAGELLRIPDGCRTAFFRGRYNLLRVRSPFDFVFTKQGLGTVFFDAKSTASQTFSYSEIDQKQITDLLRMAKQGNSAGYLIWFRNGDRVRWFDVRLLARVQPRQGLRPEHGLVVGGAATMDFKTLFVNANT